MAEYDPFLLDKIRKERDYWCECCGREYWTELHHCLVHKEKGHPELDCIENYQTVCKRCHGTWGGSFAPANSTVNRILHWHRQCERFGYNHMKDWLHKINENRKVKVRYE